MSVLGLDLGTSTCKGIVLSQDGRILAQKQVDYSHAVQVVGGTAEIDPSFFQDSVMDIIRDLAKETAEDPIISLAVSSHGETMIPIGYDGKPLMNAMLSMDRRCEKHVSRESEKRRYIILPVPCPIPSFQFLKSCGSSKHIQNWQLKWRIMILPAIISTAAWGFLK